MVGVGAIMVYARDPAGLSRWYEETLGLPSERDDSDGCYYGGVEGGQPPSVHFGIYPAGREQHGTGPVMINYRVSDLDRFVAGLRRRGVKVERRVEGPQGRFAYLRDPEGNPIELWEG